MGKKKERLSGRQNNSCFDRKITRRDFLNAALLGSGAVLLQMPSPIRLFAQTNSWEGYGGAGDYAASHGNTEELIRAYHALQSGTYDHIQNDIYDTGEVYDLVIIGGGLSGLGAAYQFRKSARKGQKCLILENHPVFGGHAKRNEFMVDGHKLTGPQASNSFVVINRRGVPGYEIFKKLKIPKKYKYTELDPDLRQLQFDRTSYGFMLWHDISPSVGFFFEKGGSRQWVTDPWGKKLEEAPYSEKIKSDFLTWRTEEKNYFPRADFRQWMDTMTYKEYIEKVMKLDPQITAFADPVLASGLGLGCDAISAYGAYQIAMPGFRGFGRGTQMRRLDHMDWHSFPGGNDGFSRYLIKYLIPHAIKGDFTFDDILNRPVHFDSLDHKENVVRIRLNATAVRVEHESGPDRSAHVLITYVKGGRSFRLKARTAVMASAGWTNRKTVRDLPEEYRNAYKNFHYSPVLVVNVALSNWRFLYKLGLTGCRWFSGFGFSCNIRRPMITGSYRQPLHPDKPAVLTFYVPLHYPGLPVQEQGIKGRKEILSTSYGEYEKQIYEKMDKLFAPAGFNPRKDIAGIILNRWLNAYLNPQPGFYFGRNGGPSPSDVIRKRFGRIAFGHSELSGHQNWSGAVEEGRRAARQVLELL